MTEPGGGSVVDGTLTIADVEVGVPAAVARVEAALDRLGVTVFARIDHAAAARAVGLELPDEVVLVFVTRPWRPR